MASKESLTNWVLVPCHNNSALLMSGLESILAQTIPVKIFAINNGSTDNTPFVLNGLENGHIRLNAYPQRGVAGAWNLGLRYLFEVQGAEKVLVVNQDVVLRPETYEILDEQNLPFVSCVSRSSRIQREDLKITRTNPLPTRPHPDFSCFLIRRDCFGRIGEFDEAFYPAWFEDNDYHIRAAKAGIELVCIDLPFYHYAAATMKNASEYDKAHYYGPGFLKSKERFQQKHNCLPGTKEYEEKCDPAYWANTTNHHSS